MASIAVQLDNGFDDDDTACSSRPRSAYLIYTQITHTCTNAYTHTRTRTRTHTHTHTHPRTHMYREKSHSYEVTVKTGGTPVPGALLLPMLIINSITSIGIHEDLTDSSNTNSTKIKLADFVILRINICS